MGPPLRTAELRAYAGEPRGTWGDGSTKDYYLRKWRRILEGRSSWAGFNWAAGFFGINWCFWRRLYLTGVLLVVAEFAASFFVGVAVVIGMGIRTPSHPALVASGYLSLLAVRIVFGALANRLYLRRATRAVAKARTREPDADARLALLRERGGTSGWGLAVSLAFSVATNVWRFSRASAMPEPSPWRRRQALRSRRRAARGAADLSRGPARRLGGRLSGRRGPRARPGRRSDARGDAMKTRLASWLVLAALAAQPAAAEPPALPREVARIPLPGVVGRIDHLALDARTGRLFVAALGNDSVEGIDLAQKRRVAHLEGFREPQGVAFLASVRKLFVTNGEGAGVTVLDGDTLARVAWVELRADPDNLRPDPGAGLLWVGEGRGAAGALAALDPESAEVVAEIPLGGHPESFQLEANGPRIFVNVPGRHEVAVVDREQRRVVARWRLSCAANFPMALDEEHRRLLVGCRRPATILVLDTGTGAPTADLRSPADADDIFLDPERDRVYVSGGEGLTRVYARPGADRFEPVGDLPTAPGARTSLFVAERRRLYVAAPAREGASAEIRVFDTSQAGRPALRPVAYGRPGRAR